MRNFAMDDAQLVAFYAGNVRAAWHACDRVLKRAGAGWYQAAHDDCAALATKHGLSVNAVAGAAAAISPGMRWDLVLHYVERLIVAGRRRLSFNIPTYSTLFVRRAQACLRGKEPSTVLGGNKVTAFYRLLVDPANVYDVCVDGHAHNIARGKHTPIRGAGAVGLSLTDKRYRLVAEAYRVVAREAGVLPHQVQAVTWIAHRAVDRRTAQLDFDAPADVDAWAPGRE